MCVMLPAALTRTTLPAEAAVTIGDDDGSCCCPRPAVAAKLNSASIATSENVCLILATILLSPFDPRPLLLKNSASRFVAPTSFHCELAPPDSQLKEFMHTNKAPSGVSIRATDAPGGTRTRETRCDEH